MADSLTVFFPQWQGAGKMADLYDGALAIALLPGGSYERIDVSFHRYCVRYGAGSRWSAS